MVRGINTVKGIQHLTALIAQGINNVKYFFAQYRASNKLDIFGNSSFQILLDVDI